MAPGHWLFIVMCPMCIVSPLTMTLVTLFFLSIFLVFFQSHYTHSKLKTHVLSQTHLAKKMLVSDAQFNSIFCFFPAHLLMGTEY